MDLQEWWEWRAEPFLRDVGDRIGQQLAQLARSIQEDPERWIKGTAAVATVAGGVIATKSLGRTRIFISFAVEDKFYRDALRQQARDNRSPFDFVDLGLEKPFTNKWKTQCRKVIQGVDGVIALISKNTTKADGARWEIKCAVEEGIPVMGMHIHKDAKGPVPSELKGQKVVEWSWPALAKFVDSL